MRFLLSMALVALTAGCGNATEVHGGFGPSEAASGQPDRTAVESGLISASPSVELVAPDRALRPSDWSVSDDLPEEAEPLPSDLVLYGFQSCEGQQPEPVVATLHNPDDQIFGEILLPESERLYQVFGVFGPNDDQIVLFDVEAQPEPVLVGIERREPRLRVTESQNIDAPVPFVITVLDIVDLQCLQDQGCTYDGDVMVVADVWSDQGSAAFELTAHMVEPIRLLGVEISYEAVLPVRDIRDEPVAAIQIEWPVFEMGAAPGPLLVGTFADGVLVGQLEGCPVQLSLAQW